MTVSNVVLGLLVLAGILELPTTCSRCMEIDGYHADIIPNTPVREFVGTRINFTCSTTLPDAYPSWKIDDIVYDTAHLPSGFVATQFDFSFPIQTTGMISCFFTIWVNETMIDICSSSVNLVPQVEGDGSRGDPRTDPRCHENNVIFSVGNEGLQMHLGLTAHGNDNVHFCVNVSCTDANHQFQVCEMAPANATSITFNLNPEDQEICNGSSTIVEKINVNHNNCLEMFYLPLVKQTEQKCINGDLFNVLCQRNTNCKICVHSKDSNKCFNTPGANEDNGAIISVYLKEYINSVQYRMVSNFELLKCQENAECTEGKCRCTENFTEVGFLCRQQKAPPQPIKLSLFMECNVPLSDGRPVLISWMNGSRVDGVVYPGEEKAMVELTPGGTVCSDVPGTSCAATITSDGNHTASLTLRNNFGSSAPVTHYFDATAILIDDAALNGIEPSINVTVNENCNNESDYKVVVLFGVRAKGSSSCDIKDVNITTLKPGATTSFFVNKTAVMQMNGQEYCFNASLEEPPTVPPSPSPVPTSETGLSPGAIAGIAVAAVVAAPPLLYAIVGFILGIYCCSKCRKKGDYPVKEVELRQQKYTPAGERERLGSSPASHPPSNDADIKNN